MASNRIKGIIIEFGGDTTRLSSALKGLDAELSKTQSQLRDVDKLLKLDPSNTELLRQKHKLLADAVDETSARLAKLKEARKEAEKNLGNYDEWKAKYEPLQKEISKTSDKLAELRTAREEMEKSGDINSDAYKKLQSEIGETEKKLSDLKQQQKELSDELGHPISPEQYDSLKREIIDTEDKLKDLEKQAGESHVALQKIAQVGEAFKKTGDAITGVGKALAPLSGAAALALGGAAKAAIDYETAFTGVMKTNDELIDENGNVIVSYEDLSDAIKDLSTRTAASKEEIAAVMEGAGQLGVGTEYLAEFTEAMVKLGDTTNLSADAAATAIAKFANVTNMSLANADRLGATLVELGNNFATDEASIMEMATRLAGAGHQIGLSEAQILGFATALSSVGIEAEMGGSAFSKAMIKMQVATETGLEPVQKLEEAFGMTLREMELAASHNADWIKEHAYQLGITKDELKAVMDAGANLRDFAEVAQMDVKDFTELFRTDAPAALQAFISGLGDTDTAGESTIQMLQDMGFTEVRLRDTLTRAASAQDLFAEAVQAGTDAWNDNSALAEEAEKRYDTTEAKLSQLRETLTNAAIDLGEILLPVIKDIIEALKQLLEWFRGLDDKTKERIVKIGLIVAALSPLLIALGSLISTVGTIMTLAPMLGTAMTVLSGPIGIAVGAVAALGTAFVVAYNKSETFRNGVNKVVGWIKDKLTAVKNWGKDLIDNFVSGISNDPILKAVTGIAKTIFDFLHFSEPEKGPLANFHTFAPDMVKTFADGITENSGLVDDAANKVAGLVKAGLDTVKDKLADIRADWETKWDAIREKARDAGDKIAGKCADLNANVKSFRDAFSRDLSDSSTAVGAFRDAATKAWDTVKNGAADMGKKLGSTFADIRKGVGEMKDKVVGAFGEIKTSISDKIEAAKTWGADLIHNFTGGISETLEPLQNAVEDAANAVADRLGFSEPKTGPLSRFHTFAPDMMALFADGIRDNIPAVADASDAVADALRGAFSPDSLSALAQTLYNSTEAVLSGLSAPLPSAYPNRPDAQNAAYAYQNAAPDPSNSLRSGTVHLSVNNMIGGRRVEQQNYTFREAETARRGPSFVKT